MSAEAVTNPERDQTLESGGGAEGDKFLEYARRDENGRSSDAWIRSETRKSVETVTLSLAVKTAVGEMEGAGDEGGTRQGSSQKTEIVWLQAVTVKAIPSIASPICGK
jgi:hypothetical protein